MQRRTFIHLSAYTAIALTIPLADGCAPSTEKILEQPLFFAHLVDAKTISEAGHAYLKQFPEEDNQTALTELLLAGGSTADKKNLQTLLDNRVKQEFKTGKTVTASGWIMSLTEARQCALYSIINT